MIRMISLGSKARVGKNLFCDLLQIKYPGKFVGLALATELKKQCDDYCKKVYKISAFTEIDSEKKIIRQYLVDFSKSKREETHGKYFTNFIEKSVNIIQEQGKIPVIQDIRYDTYSGDETNWALEKGLLIDINRYDKNGDLILPANEDETINSPKVNKKADFRIYWHTADDTQELMPYLDFLNSYVL